MLEYTQNKCLCAHLHTHVQPASSDFFHLEGSFWTWSLVLSILNAIADAERILTGHSAFIKSCPFLPSGDECPGVTVWLPLTDWVTLSIHIDYESQLWTDLVFFFFFHPSSLSLSYKHPCLDFHEEIIRLGLSRWVHMEFSFSSVLLTE